MFPLYKDDGRPIIRLSEKQKQAIEIVKDKIKRQEYKLVENKCLCNHSNPSKDIVIAEKDRFGFSIANILCSKCGLIRSQKVFDEKSNLDFYINEYRDIYTDNSTNLSIKDFFLNQKERGQYFLKLFLQNSKINLNSSNCYQVLEIGCGAGGLLIPFSEKGFKCIGTDYDINYLSYGKNKGLELQLGNYEEIVEPQSIDILILSHVLEHFLNPIDEMQKIITKVKAGGYLIIEVPGIFCIRHTYINPLLYFQNAHVFNYYYYYLKVFFEKLGLEVLYGDERCTFILQKPSEWKATILEEVYEPVLATSPSKITNYLLKLHRYQWFYKWYFKLKNKAIKSLKNF